MPYKTESDHEQKDECEIELVKFLLSENESGKLSNWAVNEPAGLELINRISTLSQRTKSMLCIAVIKHFIDLISAKDSREILYALFRSISTNSLVKLIKELNMMDVSISNNYTALIEMLEELRKYEKPEINLAILNYFNVKERWEQLILNRQGKYIPEYFMTTLFHDDSSHLNLLFEIIENNFLEYSKTNFTTFLVQCYIETYKKPTAANIIIDIMPSLTTSRNGVFVVISALKSFKNDSLYLIIDRIIELSVSFSKDQYASTIIECLFKNHTEYATRKFIQTKSENFLEIIEDQCGNYIIQKLLGIVNGDIKQNLINTLRPVVAHIKRNNIRIKWENILNNHCKNQDSVLGDSMMDCHQSIDYSKNGKSKHKQTSSEGSLIIGKGKSKVVGGAPKKNESKGYQQQISTKQVVSKTEDNSVSPLNQSTASKSSVNQPCINLNQVGNIPFINYTAYYNYNNMGPQFTQNIQSPAFYQQQYFPVNPQSQLYQIISNNNSNYYQGNGGYRNYQPQARSYTSKSGFK